MADALTLTPDLVELQRDLYIAQRAAEDYSAKVAAERREQFPGEDQWRERAV